MFMPQNRPYPSVAGSIMGQDYSALLMGEVSGNWTSPGAIPSSPALSDESTTSSEEITVNLPTKTIAAGEDALVPVFVDGVAEKGIISFDFTLRYDPNVIQPQTNAIDIDGTVSRGLSVVVNSEELGILRVSVYGAVPIGENGVLLNLRFKPVGPSGSPRH